MGLDITAYSRLNFIGHHGEPEENTFCDLEWDEEEDQRLHLPAYAYTPFPHALLGLPDVRQVHGRYGDFLYGGCYALTPSTVTHGFQAGSYSGYGVWRRGLAALFNPYGPKTTGSDGMQYDTAPHAEGPFYELIWFADNAGTITTQAARSLLEEFRRHEAAYVADRQKKPDPSQAEYDIERYREWMRACELAADDGLIDFH